MHTYSYYLDKYGEYGEVTQITYPIVSIVGLPGGKLNEIVVFETGDRGQIISLHEEYANVLLFSQTKIQTGVKVSRTDGHITTPAGKQLLGSMINPFGQPLSKHVTQVETEEMRPIDTPPQGIGKRVKITKALQTGASLVDIVIPLGKGQRQLVVGDRKTGKSTFVLTALKNQIAEGAIAIYAAIGKKTADIKQLEAFLAEDDRCDRMIIVATNASDSPGLIYLTPFTAMTLAEYFRDQGNDVVVVMDDLLTHAKFYREFSLIAQTFPGRDSYPADMFHVHARLLERAGNFQNAAYGERSITCLPIVETQDGDLTGYIVSNLMSITDGHLFFDNNVFAQGRRPAINIGLSVTRVGKQTQERLLKDINRELNSLFAIYDRVENLSHFGSEMTDSVKSIFATGNKVYSFFNQPGGIIMPKEISLILFSLIWLNILSDESAIEKARTNLLHACEEDDNRLFLRSLLNVDSFNELLKHVGDNKDKIVSLCQSSDK